MVLSLPAGGPLPPQVSQKRHSAQSDLGLKRAIRFPSTASGTPPEGECPDHEANDEGHCKTVVGRRDAIGCLYILRFLLPPNRALLSFSARS